jgi:hypothetical protein
LFAERAKNNCWLSKPNGGENYRNRLSNDGGCCENKNELSQHVELKVVSSFEETKEKIVEMKFLCVFVLILAVSCEYKFGSHRPIFDDLLPKSFGDGERQGQVQNKQQQQQQ